MNTTATKIHGIIIGIRTAGDFAIIKILSSASTTDERWYPSEWHFKGAPDLLSFIRIGDLVVAEGHLGNLPTTGREVMMATTFKRDLSGT